MQSSEPCSPVVLTAERLREVLHYEPATGVWTWLVRRRGPSNIAAGDIAGSESCGYRKIRVNWQKYSAHRLAFLYMTGAWPTEQVDHANLDRADNRWSNLRLATRPQQTANTRAHSDSTSGLKGAHWHKGRRKWRSQIVVNGKHLHLGLFPTPELAHAAYCEAAKKYFGEFARVK